VREALPEPDPARVAQQVLLEIAPVIFWGQVLLDQSIRRGLVLIVTLQDLHGCDHSRLGREILGPVEWRNALAILGIDLAPGGCLDGATVAAERRHLPSLNSRL
jgi:hypothetical protein